MGQTARPRAAERPGEEGQSGRVAGGRTFAQPVPARPGAPGGSLASWAGPAQQLGGRGGSRGGGGRGGRRLRRRKERVDRNLEAVCRGWRQRKRPLARSLP